MSVIQAIIIAIVEGITEFLPVSSTGHMALTAAILGIEKNLFTKLFIENIQFGTIISVIILYWRKFLDFKALSFYLKLFVAFLPAAVVGILLKKHIDQVLESPLFISVVMLLGGVLLLFVDKWFNKPVIAREEQISYKNSLMIGIFQLISIILPGFSRSAATIIGGMQQKLTRKTAAEFSFFLAVPTLAGAFAKSLWDTFQENPEILTRHNVQMLALGNLVGFLVAMVAIKAFITYLTRHGFRLFGYYRIVVGLILVIFLLTGHTLNII
jgi:undecaprenyl-diphosphatase